MTQLEFDDAQTAHDFGVFINRALRLDESEAVRLQATGGVLATWVKVLPGLGLTMSGLTLGLRVQRLATPAELDLCVPLVAVRDRLARLPNAALDVPPQHINPAWTATSAPRAGWAPAGTLEINTLRAAAADGIAKVAAGTPDVAGSSAVSSLRHRIWGEPIAGTAIPSGVAFAGEALGFLTGDEATWHQAAGWGRLATASGYVLARL